MKKRAPIRAKRTRRTSRAESARRPVARSKRRASTRGGSGLSAPAPEALRLPAECTLTGAGSLKLQLSELVQNAQPVTLDTADVRRIDTATLQLLAAFARDRRQSPLELRMAGESAVFEESARLLGLADLLGRPSA